MRRLEGIVMVASVWVVLSAEYRLRTVVLGLVLGWLIIRLTWPTDGGDRHPGKPFLARWLAGIRLLVVLLREQVYSNLTVARLVLTGRPASDMVRLPLDPSLSDAGRVTVANMITLTPGTITVDLESDAILVHGIQAADDPSGVDDGKRLFEDRVRRVVSRS